MLLDFGKAFRADDVFDLAGIFSGHVFIHAQVDEQRAEDAVALINTFGDLAAAFRQMDVIFTVHGDVSVFTQLFHGNADAGLGKVHGSGNIDGMDTLSFEGENEDGLQIVFC